MAEGELEFDCGQLLKIYMVLSVAVSYLRYYRS